MENLEPLEGRFTGPEKSAPPKIKLFQGGQTPLDLPFAVLVVMISCIGLIMMFSASYAAASFKSATGHNPAFFLLKQGPFMVGGLVFMYITSCVNYQCFRAFSVLLTVAAVVLLALVPIIGEVHNGAKRWILVAGVSVQPSEIAKIALIMLFSTMIAQNYTKMKTIKYGILPFGGILLIILALLYIQPHLSAMVLILGVGAVMLFSGGVKLRYFILAGGLFIPAAYFVVQFNDHAQNRIAVWKDPWLDPLVGGYQAIQSLLAVGSGGLFGLGLGESRQKYLYLPEQHNDFVFAVVAEELGLIGAIIVLLLFAVLIIRGFWIALHAKDRFGSLLVTGIMSLLAMQVFFNVAVVTSLVPVTGISMPFFSYGGTSLMIQLAEMGVVLSVSRQIKLQAQGDKS